LQLLLFVVIPAKDTSDVSKAAIYIIGQHNFIDSWPEPGMTKNYKIKAEWYKIDYETGV